MEKGVKKAAKKLKKMGQPGICTIISPCREYVMGEKKYCGRKIKW